MSDARHSAEPRRVPHSGISASVMMNESMVAMSGWIMPAPLATPAILAPPTSAVAIFGTVSVVMIPRASSSMFVGRSAETSAGSAPRSLSSGKGRPITPVDETTISFRLQPSCSASAAADNCAA